MNASFAMLCKMRRDNYSTRDHWLLTDGSEVTLCKQRNGEPAEASISMPRSEFNRLVRFYITEQPVKRKATP